jgi:hypothetical protein
MTDGLGLGCKHHCVDENDKTVGYMFNRLTDVVDT